MNKEFRIAILITLALTVIVMLYNVAQELTEAIKEDLNQVEKSKQGCLNLGGRIQEVENILYPLSFECVDYDEDGFLFYWKKSETGEVYKTR